MERSTMMLVGHRHKTQPKPHLYGWSLLFMRFQKELHEHGTVWLCFVRSNGNEACLQKESVALLCCIAAK